MTPIGAPPREWEPPSPSMGSSVGSRLPAGHTMKKAKRDRLHAKFARLQRHLEICLDPHRPGESGPARPDMPRRLASSSA